MDIQNTVSRVVRVYMAARDETQEELGQALGLSRAAVTMRLSNKAKWSLGDLEVLQEHYGVTLDQLLKGPILEELGAVVRRSSGTPRAPRATRRSA